MGKTYSKRQAAEKQYHDDKTQEGAVRAGDDRVGRAGEYFWQIVGEPESATVLDFGCGNGWLSIRLARNGNRVYGFDISTELVKQAVLLAAEAGVSANTTFFEMTAEELEIPNVMFDLVVGNSILHHTELEVTLRNIRGILKDDGVAVFLEPLNENLALKVWRMLTPWRRTPTERALTASDLDLIRKLFPSSRFRFFYLTSIATQGLLLWRPGSTAVQWLNAKLEKLDDWVFGLWPWMGKYAAVVTLEMRL